MTKLAKLSSLKADLALERAGDWIPAPEIGPDTAFLVRSTNFPDFVTARDEDNLKLAKKYGDSRIPEEVMARVNGALAVEHLLLGWRGFDEEYTEDLAATVLTDEAFRSLRTSVFVAAMKVGKKEVEFVKEAEKNSGAPSGTS